MTSEQKLIWPVDYINQIIQGDCLEVMRGMPDGCVDSIVTDPPAGISFMGKSWDDFSQTTNTYLYNKILLANGTKEGCG